MKNPFTSIRIFTIEIVDELKKATWPTMSELRDSTVVVVAAGSYPRTCQARVLPVVTRQPKRG